MSYRKRARRQLADEARVRREWPNDEGGMVEAMPPSRRPVATGPQEADPAAPSATSPDGNRVWPPAFREVGANVPVKLSAAQRERWLAAKAARAEFLQRLEDRDVPAPPVPHRPDA